MTNRLQFMFDFASPNAYLVHKTLNSYLDGVDVNLVYHPVLLGGLFKVTGNQPPMQAFAPVKGKLDYEHLEIKRYIKKFGLSNFRMNPHFPVNTLLMMRAAIVAEREGYLLDYVDAGFQCMWEDGLLMSDPEVFMTSLTALGLDGKQLAEDSQDEAVKAKLVFNTQDAADRGAFGIPTFFVGNEMFFGKDRLDQVVAELKAE